MRERIQRRAARGNSPAISIVSGDMRNRLVGAPVVLAALAALLPLGQAAERELGRAGGAAPDEDVEPTELSHDVSLRVTRERVAEYRVTRTYACDSASPSEALLSVHLP